MDYNIFKNDFISDIYTSDIKLNQDQITKVLKSLDRTSRNFDIYSKSGSSALTEKINGIPKSIYDYLDIKKAEGCSDGTLYIYRLMLEVFFHNICKSPEQVTADDIRDFLMEYKTRNPISNRSLDKYRGYICGYFTYLHDYGLIPKNIAKQVNKIKYEIKHKDILTDYECELIREACETKRELAMVEFLLATACRIGELVKVRLIDIDFDRNTVLLFGKGSKERIGFFNARCKLALLRYLEERPCESDYLFVYDRAPYENLTTRGAGKVIKQIIAKVDSVCEVKHITPHRFRATTATRCIERGMSIYDVSNLLGHTKVSTTQIYLEQSMDSLHKAYNMYM